MGLGLERIVEIHPKDSWHAERDKLIGAEGTWVEKRDSLQAGYSQGVFMFTERPVGIPRLAIYFLAVKTEAVSHGENKE